MRVIELSDTEEAAAYCGKLHARWGAEVIRVERRGRPSTHPALETYLHGGKRRVALDVDTPAGQTALERLVASADLLVTDVAPSRVDALRLLEVGGSGWRGTRVSITPFGLSGPYRDHEATAATLLAIGGHTYLSGDPGRPPLTIPGNYPHYQAGTYAYVASLAGYLRDLDGGAPLNIEVAIHEVLSALHQFTDVMWTHLHRVRSRHGNRWENLCPTTLYRCADGWVGVNILQNFWAPFAYMIGRPELIEDPLFETNAARMERRDEVADIVAAAFAGKTRLELFREGQETFRVPIGALLSLEEVLADPHLAERGFWRPLEGSTPHVRVAGSPFTFEGEPPPSERAPERAGATSAESLLAAPAPPRPPAPGMVHATSAVHRPLEGIRVADLTRIWSGPIASRILGDLGAEVIKIEAPTGRGPAEIPASGRPGSFPDGDPGEHPWNRNGLNNKLNRNKLSVAIDLKAPEGRQAFLELVAISDVVIENFSARAMPSLGLDYSALRAANPRVIYLSMPAFGHGGVYESYVGLGPSIEPVTGWTALMGYGPDEPRTTAQALTDAISGTAAAAALLTALRCRAETGEGAYVDLSQEEAGVAFFGEQFIERQLAGAEPVPLGNGHPRIAPHGVYRCAGDDQWIALAARTDEEWRALDAFAGCGWSADPRFATNADRLAHREMLDAAMEAWTGAFDKFALARDLQALRIPAAPVVSAPEWHSDAHLEARGFFVEYDELCTGHQRYDGSPLVFNDIRGYETFVRAAGMGEHNRAVLGGLLGYTDDRLAELEERGVIVDRPPA